MTASSDLPYPPFELADRVSSLPSNDFSGFVLYEIRGRELHQQLLSMLPEGYSFEGRSVLDFGCGAGRTLRHFHDDAATARFVGCDIDGQSIDWLRENMSPPFEVFQSEVDPPLPLEEGTFDFIWAVSVFSHLSDNSAAWLLELRRLLKPDGLLMASYMGKFNSELLAREEWDEDRIGMNVLRHNQDWDEGGPSVFMSDWWVDEHWGRAFSIEDRVDFHGQTWTLLRKSGGLMSVEELLAPGSDPREFAALRHNLAQVQAELEEQKEISTGLRRELDLPLKIRLRRRLGMSWQDQ